MQLNAKTMGGTPAAMEEEGLVERQPHPTDGRQILYVLTDEGREAKAKVSLAKREWLLSAVDIIRRFGNL
jgi:DNA-binding MarR family transcriptional regulator